MALIGLISDVHAYPVPLEAAFSLFAERRVEKIFCAGDIAGYGEQLQQTIALLQNDICQSILGNHDIAYINRHESEPDNMAVDFLKHLPATIEQTIAGKRLNIVHAQPPDGCHGGIKLLSKDGDVLESRIKHWDEKLQTLDCDVLVVGHTHQVFVEKIADTLVVNPGSSAFNNSCAILHLPEMTVELIALSEKGISKTWNWGDHVIHAS